MSKNRRNKRDRETEKPKAPPRSGFRLSPSRLSLVLLIAGLLSALAVYGICLNGGWFYDDSDYVLSDPRLNHLELFTPAHWSDPPPKIDSHGEPLLYLPGYDRPMITDRYLWHLSFALEHKLSGEPSPFLSHLDNLLIHLLCIGMLFVALTALVRLYLEDSASGGENHWRALPGLAALIFAIHPWASEPVCYVSARDGSMGAFFVFAGLAMWATAMRSGVAALKRSTLLCGVLLSALAAYGCKENFITAIPAFVLATWPVLWRRAWKWSQPGTIVAVAGTIGAFLLVAWLGIHYSDRAKGLYQQAIETPRGGVYLFQIQNPLVLMTLTDQIPARRVALESNFPGWPLWACMFALVANLALILFSFIQGFRWPVLLGIVWYYLFLTPTNSFLPRPDFLAQRNVYVTVAGSAVLFASTAIALWQWNSEGVFRKWWSGVGTAARFSVRQLRFALVFAGTSLLIYWSIVSAIWAHAFVYPEEAWGMSVAVTPDHGVLQLNLAGALINQSAGRMMDETEFQKAENAIKACMRAEHSQTMSFQTPRHAIMRQALARRLWAYLRMQKKDYAYAADLLRESYHLAPSLTTWASWAEAALDGQLEDSMNEVISEGQNAWPNDWWTDVVRGFRDNSTLPLESALRAPNSPQPELRQLQARAIWAIAQSGSGTSRATELIARLQELGVANSELQKLQAATNRTPR